MESFTNTATSDTEMEMMRDANSRAGKRRGRSFAAMVALTTLALSPWCLAQQPDTTSFSTAEEASHALYLAVQSDDEQAMTSILGAGEELVSLGDKARDQLERERFTRKYQEMHRLVREPDATTVLYIGAENWPFPIPLVFENGAWHFDAKIGMEEVLFRRIGENEVTAIEACHALAAPEKDHTRLVGDASGRSTRALRVNAGNDGSVVAFHGYYFRALTGRGKNTTGSTRLISDRKTPSGKFAFVAYPAEYRSTGAMTYLVNQDGVVYEKDLGPDTVRIAKGMTRYNPDSTWHPAE